MYKRISMLHFSMLFFNSQILFLSACTTTLPISYESVKKLPWKTNVLRALPWAAEELLAYRYSSNRCAKGGCLWGGYSAESQSRHAPRQEARFFLSGILVHLDKSKSSSFIVTIWNFALCFPLKIVLHKTFTLIPSFVPLPLVTAIIYRVLRTNDAFYRQWDISSCIKHIDQSVESQATNGGV